MTRGPLYENILCEAHDTLLRYFVEAIPPELEKAEIAETTSGQALKRINELFALDKDLAELPVTDRQQERLRLEEDKLEALFVWLKTIQPETAPKSALGKAVNYVLNHQECLSVYTAHGEVAMSNNICERAIRNFTIGRNNQCCSLQHD